MIVWATATQVAIEKKRKNNVRSRNRFGMLDSGVWKWIMNSFELGLESTCDIRNSPLKNPDFAWNSQRISWFALVIVDSIRSQVSFAINRWSHFTSLTLDERLIQNFRRFLYVKQFCSSFPYRAMRGIRSNCFVFLSNC